MKKLIFILLVVFSVEVNAQNLSIKQTLTYIKNNSNIDSIELFNDTIKIFMNETLIKSLFDDDYYEDYWNVSFNYRDIVILKDYISDEKYDFSFLDLSISSYRANFPSKSQHWGLIFLCNRAQKQIKYGKISWKTSTGICLDDGSELLPAFYVLSKENNKVSATKLYNAFDYLFKKIRQTVVKKKPDNDPFSPKNYGKTPNVNVTNYRYKDQLNFNPFLGVVTSNVNFRTGPSQSYPVTTILSPGTNLYIFSPKTTNDYYKAIDISSGKIGWLYKSYVKYIQNVKVDETNDISSIGYIKSYNPKVEILNKSSYAIKLIVDNKTISLSPFSKKIIYIKPGKKYFIATIPGIIPASGYKTFKANNGYKWEFMVKD